MTIYSRVLRARAADFVLADPVLADDQMGLETDTGKFKYGDGVAHFSALSYASGGANFFPTAFNDAVVAGFGGTWSDYYSFLAQDAMTSEYLMLVDFAERLSQNGTAMSILQDALDAGVGGGPGDALSISNNLSELIGTAATARSNIGIVDATSTQKGLVELATSAEVVAGLDDTRAATPAGVKVILDALIGAAPGTLNTLAEIATAIGNTSNFATVVTDALNLKQPLNDTLTALAGLTTTTFGRNLLTAANAGVVASMLELDNVQTTVTIPIQLSNGFEVVTPGLKWTGKFPHGIDVQKVILNSATPSTNGDLTVVMHKDGTLLSAEPMVLEEGETSSVYVGGIFIEIDWADSEEFSFTVVNAGTGVTQLRAWVVGFRDDTNEGTDIPTSTVQVDESFNGTDGEEISDITTTADGTTGGPGTLTHSAEHTLDNTSMMIDGTTAETAYWTVPTHTTSKKKFYIWHEQNPSEDAFFLVTLTPAAAVAYKVGVDETGHLIVQNGNAGTIDVANFVLEPQTLYKLEETTAVGGSVQYRIYTGSAINNDNGVGASDTIAVSLTAASLGEIHLGLWNDIVGGGSVVAPNLTNEFFEGNGASIINGDTITQARSTASTVTTGLTFSNTWSSQGSFSGRYQGTAAGQMIWNWTTRSFHGARGRIRIGTAPTTSERHWWFQLRNGANSATAMQVGIDSTLALVVRNAASGAAVLSAGVLALNTDYEITIEVTAATVAGNDGEVIVRAYTGATIESENTADAFTSVTITNMTAQDLSREVLGNNAALTASVTLYFDNWRSSSVAVPSPNGAVGAVGLKMWIDRFKADTTTMPSNFNVVIDSEVVNSKLVPANGCWWGAATPPIGSSTTNPAGLAAWVGFARRRPDIIHWYKQAANWSGTPTPEEISMAQPSGGTRAIMFYNWKVRGGSLTFAQVAAGLNNTNIINWSRNIGAYPFKIMICLEHEPENNNGFSTTGNSATDYAAMWRHVVTLARANGANNVVWVWNMTGYSSTVGSNGSVYNAAYPGDDIIDWIAENPYFQSTNRVDFGNAYPDDPALVQENIAGTTGWQGWYHWATTAKTVGVNGLAYAFAGTKPLMLAEWGTWFDVMTDAQCATRIRTVGSQIRDFPRFKALVHWNNNQDHMNHIDGNPLSEDAFGDVGEDPYLNVGTVNAS